MDRKTVIPMVTRLVSLANTRTAPKVACDRWQVEHTRLLQRICTRIEARVQAGAFVNHELKRAAQRWQGRKFSGGRPVRLSEGTLRRVFYTWRKHGTDALQLNYKPAASKVPAAIVREFLEICLEGGTMSRAEAIRIVQLGKGRGFSVESFYRSVPRGVRAKITALHRARLHAWRLEAKLRKEMAL